MTNIKEHLIKKGIINDAFDSQGLDESLVTTYKYFEKKFEKLYQSYARVFFLRKCCFYINNDYYRCNAYAARINGYNIIKITNAYPILLKDRFKEEYFKRIVLIGLNNKKSISDAYCSLYQDKDFKFGEFMMNCSIHYTFHHEFEHILQFNASNLSKDFSYAENLEKNDFNIKKHAWEFFADKLAAYGLLKYIHDVYHWKLKINSKEKFICLFYIAVASIFITKSLFYFGITNPIYSDPIIDKQDFYTKKYSHPHPLVRLNNIFNTLYYDVPDFFPELNIDAEEMLYNVWGISKLYFDALIPGQNVMQTFIDDNQKFWDEINSYNDELYDYSIQDDAIRTLLKKRGINFSA